jgi:hypothetical protein
MNRTIRHFLAALRYRAHRALDGAPDGFGDFSAGAGSRTPVELVRHMASLMGFSRARLGDEPASPLAPVASLEAERARFEEALSAFSHELHGPDLDVELQERLLQGPLADAMTHVGQLALLRRLSGSPVPAVNFFTATIDSTDL